MESSEIHKKINLNSNISIDLLKIPNYLVVASYICIDIYFFYVYFFVQGEGYDPGHGFGLFTSGVLLLIASIFFIPILLWTMNLTLKGRSWILWLNVLFMLISVFFMVSYAPFIKKNPTCWGC